MDAGRGWAVGAEQDAGGGQAVVPFIEGPADGSLPVGGVGGEGKVVQDDASDGDSVAAA